MVERKVGVAGEKCMGRIIELKHSYFGILSSYKWVDKCTYDNFDSLDIIQMCLINCCKMYTKKCEGGWILKF